MMRYLVLMAVAGVLAINVADQVRPVVLDSFGAVAAALENANAGRR